METFERLNNSVLSLPSTLSVPTWLVIARLYQITHIYQLASKRSSAHERGVFLINSALASSPGIQAQ